MHNLTIIISKLMDFLNKLKTDKNLIQITYNNFKKLYNQKQIFKNNNFDNNEINCNHELYNILRKIIFKIKIIKLMILFHINIIYLHIILI